MRFFYRVIGIALIIAAIGGLIFSIVGIVFLWRYRPAIQESLLANVTLAGDMLVTTSSGLAVANQSLATSIASISALENTVEATARTIQTSTPLIETLADLSEQDLPQSVEAAQTSLEAAQDSARIIDSVLNALTSLPFVSRDIYNPPVPLHIALQQVSDSLDELPASLETINTSLDTAGDNLAVIETDINQMAVNIRQIQTSLEDARDVVEQYHLLVQDMQTRVDRTEARLPRQVDLMVWVATFVLLWTIVLQFSMLVQGWDLLNRRYVE